MSIFLPATVLDYGGNDAFTKILLHMDGANAGTVFTDSNAGGSAHTWTATTATTDTGNAKFGSAGDNNNSGWVETPSSSDFNLGSGDWTIDFRLKMGPTDGTQYRLFGQCDSATTPTTISVGGSRVRSNVLSFTAEVGSTAFSVTGTTTFLNGGAYRHVAFVRSGS